VAREIGVAQRIGERASLLARERARSQAGIGRSMMFERDDFSVVALCFDANDRSGLARSGPTPCTWRSTTRPRMRFGLVPTDDTSFRIEFQASRRHKAGKIASISI